MKKVVLILFLLFPALIVSAILILPDNALSELENRSLKTRDQIGGSIADGSFQSDLEGFLSDQFPLREKLVYLQTYLRFITGQRDIGGAYICPDGRLIQKIADAQTDEKALVSYADKIDRIASRYKVYVMYVPSACVELRNELPAGAPVYNYRTLYDTLAAHLENAALIDLADALSEPGYYYKTDHHWTVSGAYEAYRAFCEARGTTAGSQESFRITTVSDDFRGTLFSKAPFSKQTDEIAIPSVPDVEVTADGTRTDFYRMDALETKDQYSIFQGGNHGLVEIVNENGGGGTLLILKDSFANSFVPFLLGEYSKIVMVDERYTFLSLSDLVDALSPDEILVLREIVD